MRTMHRILLLSTLACGGAAAAEYTAVINLIDTKGVGAAIGSISIAPTSTGAVAFAPGLKGLPPGDHGFHVHEFPNCGPKEKDGKLAAGEAAGDHWDPDKTKKHAGPKGGGHRGDLPVLKVDAKGRANRPVVIPNLKFADLKGKSIVIHAAGDNYSDQPKPNGGGGDRIACGIIEAGGPR